MFREMDRLFAPGASAGGAGATDLQARGFDALDASVLGDMEIRFRVVPLEFWDSPEGPLDRALDEARIRLFRRGAYRPEITVNANQMVRLPPGDWYYFVEAPWYVSTSTTRLSSRPSEKSYPGDLVVGVAPACRVSLDVDSPADVDRIDLVSITEAAVYPLTLPTERSAVLPAGEFFAYTVREGEVVALGEIARCEFGGESRITQPAPPTDGTGGLIVTVEGPRGAKAHDLDSLHVSFDETEAGSRPFTRIIHGGRATFFFVDLPAGKTLFLSIEHPTLADQKLTTRITEGGVQTLEAVLQRIGSRTQGS